MLEARQPVADTRHHSGRFLQPNQSTVWSDYRILLAADMPGDEGDRRVSPVALRMKNLKDG